MSASALAAASSVSCGASRLASTAASTRARGRRFVITSAVMRKGSQKRADASVKVAAVMAPDMTVVPPGPESRAGDRRVGMGRHFADEYSLDMPADLAAIRNYWYPVHFTSKLERGNAQRRFPLFAEEWEIVKADAATGTEAAASVAATFGAAEGEKWGSVEEWVCRNVNDTRRYLPVAIQDGLLMVWPGTCKPEASLPTAFKPPDGYTVHAELVIDDVPVEHGLLMENLLDLAHAPFTHTGTFAKGWGVPNFVEFVTSKMRSPGDGWMEMANGLKNLGSSQGSWNPYPIDMKFVTPCMVDSHIGMSQAGAAGSGAQFEKGKQCAECQNHLHQLHVCTPSTPGRTRLLYRMSLDFAGWAKFVPGIELVWTEMASQVLGEDLRLVTGQQDRMARGGRVWAHPVAYDKLGLVYRRWRNYVVDGKECDIDSK